MLERVRNYFGDVGRQRRPTLATDPTLGEPWVTVTKGRTTPPDDPDVKGVFLADDTILLLRRVDRHAPAPWRRGDFAAEIGINQRCVARTYINGRQDIETIAKKAFTFAREYFEKRVAAAEGRNPRED